VQNSIIRRFLNSVHMTVAVRTTVGRLLFSNSPSLGPSFFVSSALYKRSAVCSPFLFSKHTSRTKSVMAAVAVANNLPSELATVDLSAYDPEQSKLMEERCILVDAQDRAYGAGDKKTCHLMENIHKGLLHRAFSVFIFRPSDGKLLLQKRASGKITFPDMWTNTCCSHPLDDFEEEKVEKDQFGVRVAASRKLEHELGIPKSQTPIDEFQYLTKIHYLAPSDGVWGEHEVDYILFLAAHVDVTPNLNEIQDYKYVNKEELRAMFDDPEFAFTPWFKLIARGFLFRWWDELIRRSDVGNVNAKTLNGIVDGSKVVSMV